MRVELRITLKIASNNIIPAGTVFDTQLRPLPEFVLNRLRRKQAIILSATPAELSAYGLPTTLATSHPRVGGVPPARGKAERKKVVTEEKSAIETAEEPPPHPVIDEEGSDSPTSLGEAASAADPDIVAALEGEPKPKPKKKKSTTKKKFVKKEKTE